MRTDEEMFSHRLKLSSQNSSPIPCVRCYLSVSSKYHDVMKLELMGFQTLGPLAATLLRVLGGRKDVLEMGATGSVKTRVDKLQQTPVTHSKLGSGKS